MNKPSITRHPDGAWTFQGPAAVDVYRITVLASSLGLYAKTGIIPTRGMTITRMLAIATEYTRKPYKRGEALKAKADLNALAGIRVAIIAEES